MTNNNNSLFFFFFFIIIFFFFFFLSLLFLIALSPAPVLTPLSPFNTTQLNSPPVLLKTSGGVFWIWHPLTKIIITFQALEILCSHLPA
jgi:hypothetical protein